MKYYLIILLLLLSTGCVLEEPKYQEGEFVKSVLSGQKGQVIKSFIHDGWMYKIRLESKQEYTNTSLIGSDGPITVVPLSVIYMREFEIEPYTRKEK